MKLTEEKLKQLIKEAINTASLPHLNKLAEMFAKSADDAMQAMSFIEMLDEYSLKSEPFYDNDGYRLVIQLKFKDASVARQLFDALLEKGVQNAPHWSARGPTAKLRTPFNPNFTGGSILLFHPINPYNPEKS